jgi:hypothetical protein
MGKDGRDSLIMAMSKPSKIAQAISRYDAVSTGR